MDHCPRRERRAGSQTSAATQSTFPHKASVQWIHLDKSYLHPHSGCCCHVSPAPAPTCPPFIQPATYPAQAPSPRKAHGRRPTSSDVPVQNWPYCAPTGLPWAAPYKPTPQGAAATQRGICCPTAPAVRSPWTAPPCTSRREERSLAVAIPDPDSEPWHSARKL